MTSSVITLAAALAAMNPIERDHAELVILTNCIGQVESGMDFAAKGDRGKALGAWQMHPEAWITANQWLRRNHLPTVSRKDWMPHDNQRAVALAYVKWCHGCIQGDGIDRPTPEQVYLAFSMGYSAAKAAGHSLVKAPKAKAEAAERVGNLYRELTK